MELLSCGVLLYWCGPGGATALLVFVFGQRKKEKRKTGQRGNLACGAVPWRGVPLPFG